MTRNTADRRRRRQATVALGGVSALLLTGCSQGTVDDWKRAGFPAPATEEADRMLHLWQGSWIAALAVGALVWGLIFWSIIVYRRRHSGVPDQVRYNLPVEIMYTVVPLIMIGGMFFFTARDQAQIMKVENNQDLTVGVVGMRWSWIFNYVDENTYEIGTPGQDPTLYLPIDQKVKFELTSPDVVHSFWVPAFLFKLDVIPGRTNVFEVTPNKEGTFRGKCAELCGVDHSRMLFNVKVVSQEEFDAHMQELREKGQFGQLTSGRATESAQGV
ncbi:MAG TPA: cytochrome c oxidase subunit II [Actinomycetota bacterium]|nr:cytochrome c oxidase subunit II [Actinomycetota bacterium]